MPPLPKIPIQPAKLLSSKTHQVPGKLLITELFFSVPLDHAKPDGERLKLFCRSAEKFEKPAAPTKKAKDPETTPWFVYITGGPGFAGPRPQDSHVAHEVLQKGYKFLSFDHRGMGLSNTITTATLALRGSATSQAEYLSHFRADNAVRDLEAIRLALTASITDPDSKKWSILGQSYGGFVSLTYLSFYPEGLREVFPLGGLAPVTQALPDEPIRRAYRRVAQRNERYFAKYPEDVERVRRVAQHLDRERPLLPTGVPLSSARFLGMGIYFGFHGGFDRVHEIVLRADWDLDVFGFLTRPTLAEVEANTGGFDEHVIYALLHGSLYAQGKAPAWVFDRIREEFAEFDYQATIKQGPVPASGQEGDGESKVFFTGEMVFKSAFDDYAELRPLKDVVTILEQKHDWPDLYDLEQLARNDVPVYAAVYNEDMYVDLDFSLETANLVKGAKVYQTNVMYHDAVRSKAGDVLKALWELRDDTID